MRVFYTDGSSGKSGFIGWSFIEVDLNTGNILLSVCGSGIGTNQVAELLAIHRVLELVEEESQEVLIITDSQYSISCFTEYADKWIKNGWVTYNGEPVKNQELIKSGYARLKLKKVHFHHIKGHSGDGFNDEADRLAKLARHIKEGKEELPKDLVYLEG